jgi:hypothetical protein
MSPERAKILKGGPGVNYNGPERAKILEGGPGVNYNGCGDSVCTCDIL